LKTLAATENWNRKNILEHNVATDMWNIYNIHIKNAWTFGTLKHTIATCLRKQLQHTTSPDLLLQHPYNSTAIPMNLLKQLKHTIAA